MTNAEKPKKIAPHPDTRVAENFVRLPRTVRKLFRPGFRDDRLIPFAAEPVDDEANLLFAQNLFVPESRHPIVPFAEKARVFWAGDQRRHPLARAVGGEIG